MDIQQPIVQAVRPSAPVGTLQGLPYQLGIDHASVGSQGLSMHLITIPPGARAEPHLHVGYETAIYVLSGRVRTRWGAQLEHEIVSAAGEFLFIPPGVPHDAQNLSDSEPARAVVARNSAADREAVEPYSPPGT